MFIYINNQLAKLTRVKYELNKITNKTVLIKEIKKERRRKVLNSLIGKQVWAKLLAVEPVLF